MVTCTCTLKSKEPIKNGYKLMPPVIERINNCIMYMYMLAQYFKEDRSWFTNVIFKSDKLKFGRNKILSWTFSK